MNNAARKEEEQRVQRTAEREGRRMRRRRGKWSHIWQFQMTFQCKYDFQCLTFHFYFICQSMDVDRERNETLSTHFDGMSSDDEIPDQEATLYKNQLSKTNT